MAAIMVAILFCLSSDNLRFSTIVNVSCVKHKVKVWTCLAASSLSSPGRLRWESHCTFQAAKSEPQSSVCPALVGPLPEQVRYRSSLERNGRRNNWSCDDDISPYWPLTGTREPFVGLECYARFSTRILHQGLFLDCSLCHVRAAGARWIITIIITWLYNTIIYL